VVNSHLVCDPQSGNRVLTSLSNSGLYWSVFACNSDTAVPVEGNGDLQTLICRRRFLADQLWFMTRIWEVRNLPLYWNKSWCPRWWLWTVVQLNFWESSDKSTTWMTRNKVWYIPSSKITHHSFILQYGLNSCLMKNTKFIRKRE